MKKILLKLYNIIPPRIREIVLQFLNYLNIAKYADKCQYINKNYEDDYYSKTRWGKYNEERKHWYKNYKKILNVTNEREQIYNFYNDKMEIVRQGEFKKGKVILICLVKNDLVRIKELIKHYKNIGVYNFAIIDNNSTDGTFEFLLSQPGFYIFSIKEKYSTMRRQAWINRVISYFGLNKWYIIVDSDEFLCYNGMDLKDIDNLVDYCVKKKIKRMKSLMVDMYPKTFLMENGHDELFMKKFKYFDVSGYKIDKNKFFLNVIGGMRSRLFKVSPYLVKMPLIYIDKKTIQYNSHYSFPFYCNYQKEINLALLHYKFLPSDFDKITDAIKNENFASGSKEYKKYFEIYNNDKKACLISDESEIYNNTDDIYKIKVLSKIEWESNNDKKK